jgi:hypothetical protein
VREVSAGSGGEPVSTIHMDRDREALFFSTLPEFDKRVDDREPTNHNECIEYQVERRQVFTMKIDEVHL